MKRNGTISQIITLMLLAAMTVCLFSGCGRTDADASDDYDGSVEAVDGGYLVAASETGPILTHVLLKLNTKVDAVDTNKAITVTTNGNSRTVSSACLTDKNGNEVDHASSYVDIALQKSSAEQNELMQMTDEQHLEWVSEYDVAVSLSVEKDGSSKEVSYQNSSLDNMFSEELSRFSVNDTYTGTYENPLTGDMDELSLNWAAYEPEDLSGGEQNPLIIWLHGRWEGGTDMSDAILGNKVSALTEDTIQSYFTSDDGSTGAYVLLVQTPTYWMDAGNGEEGEGDTCSRYTEILMDTILNYLQENPDVDPSRIYLGGGSNGGYMTVEMLIHYPDFFAAGFPVSEAYSYYEYLKKEDGSYVTGFNGEGIQTGCNISDSDIQALCRTPIWFVQAQSDTVVPAQKNVLPLYRALLKAGADNCWLSLYDEVVGKQENTIYNNHWAWIYVFNDSVVTVQNTESVLNASAFVGFGSFGGFAPWAQSSAYAGFSANSAGGSTGVSDGEGGTYSSIFAWLNAQSL